MSVWHFLINNEKGAIFQLKPKKREKDPEENDDSKNEEGDDHLFEDFMDEYLAEIPKYITLNQVNVKIAGGTDKLLVVRDVTSIVMNENIMETKREMSKLTDVLMRQIEDHTTITEQKLQKLDQYVAEGLGTTLNDESINEIKKMQFRIKDFQQVYFVSENNFRHKSEPVNMKSCIDEVVAMTAADVKSRKIELLVNVDEDVPDQIACDVSKLKQVLLNLLLQNFNNQFRITVKVNVSLRQADQTEGHDPYIIIDIENSKYEAKQKEIHRLNRLAVEKDFAKILESKCELNFKIAKILTNAVGWKINFNSFRQGKQTLMIPARKYIDKDKPPADTGSKMAIVEEQEAPPAAPEEPTPQQEALDLPQLNQVQTVDLDQDDDALKKRTARARLKAEKQRALKEEQLAQELELQKRTALDREKILKQEQKMKSIEKQITSQMKAISKARADVKKDW